MSNSTTRRLINVIKTASETTNTTTSQIVSLKIQSLSPLIFLYNEKLFITSDFYILDQNFSTDNLNVGDFVKALKTNNGQTYYILGNKLISSGGGGTTDYSELENKPSINGTTLIGNKSLEDLGIDIPTKTSDLQNDSGFISSETDPTVPNVVKSITSSDISNWNNKSDFSGNYNDLTNKPNIPSKTSDLTNDSNFVSDANYTHTDNNYTSTEKTKLSGIETNAEVNKIDTIKVNSVTQTITNKTVDITGLQNEITSSNKLASDLVDDTSQTNQFVTSSEKTNWNAKQDPITLTAGGSYYILDLDPGVYVIPYNTSANTRIYDKSNGTVLFQTMVTSYQPIATNYYSGILLVDRSIINSGWVSTDSKYYEIIGNASITYGNVTSSNYTKNTLGLSQIQKTSNLVTTLSSSSTNTQYPSAKLLYDQLQLKSNHDNVAKDFWYGTQAEYDALATKDANTIYMTDEDTITPIATTINENSTNTELAGAKAVYDNSLDVYSTEEQRVGTWIDGKPIYSKTYQLTTVANPSSTQNLITFSDVDNIVKIEGYVISSPSTYFVPYYFNNTAFAQAYRNSSTSVKILCGSSYGFGDTTITIFYSKTTD